MVKTFILREKLIFITFLQFQSKNLFFAVYLLSAKLCYPCTDRNQATHFYVKTSFYDGYYRCLQTQFA